jgi:DNA-binding winged helix-turn-helix (wHTH) protein
VLRFLVLFEFDDFVLDESAYELKRGGIALKIEPKVFEMLAYMLRRPGQLVTRDDFVKYVWEGRALSDSVLTGTVARLRSVLRTDAPNDLIVSIYGRGYRFVGSVRQRAEAVSGLPFVGRRHAFSCIQQCLAQARSGRGRIVAIVGEPGIGKTHLAEVCAESASAVGVPSAWGRCRDLESTPPFWPFVQMFRDALRSSSSGTTRDVVQRVVASLTPKDNPPAGWGLETPNSRVFDDIMRALQRLTEGGPLLLVLDDLQWADAASLRLLAHIAPEISRMRLLILATQRNAESFSGDGRFAHGLRHLDCERIELDRLTKADVAEYTALSLGTAESEVSQAVFDKSEGNPFFMVELLRPFGRSSRPRVDELALTGSTLDIVRHRLRRLSKEAAELLTAAAIIGREFELGWLADLVEREPAKVREQLESAGQTRGLPSSPGRPEHLAFRHDLVCSLLLEELSATKRARLHLRAAEALDRRSPVGDGLPRPELVHHLLSAVPFGDVTRVIDYAKRAALAAAHVCAHADAANLSRRALSALEFGTEVHPRLRCDLLLGLSHCERASAEGPFAEHLAEAVALAREHGFGEILAVAGRRMSLAPGFTALKGAREVLEAADRALPANDHVLRSEVLAHLSWTAPYSFDAELAVSLVARAEALAAKSNDSFAMAIALSAKFYFESGPDSRAVAEEIAHRIECLYAERPPLIRVHWSTQRHFSRIVTALQEGDMDAVDRSISALGAAARELKHPELEWQHQRACLIHRMNRGLLRGLKPAFEELQERAKSLHLFYLQSVRALDLSVLQRETDDVSASAFLESTLTPQEMDCPFRRARKIRCILELGAIEKARTALCEHSADKLARLPRDRDYLATLAHLAVVSGATQSQAHSEALYALLAPYPHLHAADLSLHCDGSISYFLGTLARSLGRLREATMHLEEAIDRNERAGFTSRAVHSVYELASVLSDSDNLQMVKRARMLFARVTERAPELGMEPLRRQAQRQLQVA